MFLAANGHKILASNGFRSTLWASTVSSSFIFVDYLHLVRHQYCDEKLNRQHPREKQKENQINYTVCICMPQEIGQA